MTTVKVCPICDIAGCNHIRSMENQVADKPMTPEQIASARALADAATPGPWEAEKDQPYNVPPCVYSAGAVLICECACYGTLQDQWEADARFIAWCREGVPALAAALASQTARAEAAEAREAALLATNETERQTLIRHNAAHAAQVAELTAKLEAWLRVYDNCEIAAHVCCCGDNMEGHAEPMDCGHMATDHGSYYAGKLAEETRAAIKTGAQHDRRV